MTHPLLARKLGLLDATLIGLASMLGAGVFVAFAPAAQAAGGAMLIALLIAAVVAYCNATASAQLAAQFPSAGGTYIYGRELIGPWTGFFAGWSFVIGKTASCAAMALTFAFYVAPEGWERPTAAVLVAIITAINYVGISRTALVARVIVFFVIAVLLLTVIASASAGWDAAPLIDLAATTPYGVLQAAGLLFFAFAGYARVATLGEEVRDPAKTIPRAILAALAVAVVLYAAVGAAVLGVLGQERLAASTAPLADAVAVAGWLWAQPIVWVAAAAASAGALLALMAGIGRTTLAMARNGDLPRGLAAVHPRFSVPHRAELLLGAIVMVIVLAVDVRGAIGFSSFGVLLYYFVANVAAHRQDAANRRFARPLQLLGAAGCLALVAALPWQSIVAGVGVLAIGVAIRAITHRNVTSR